MDTSLVDKYSALLAVSAAALSAELLAALSAAAVLALLYKST